MPDNAVTAPAVQLIPREVLFGNPDKIAPKLSPDGVYLSYVAPLNGVLNVWLRTVGLEDDRPLTRDEGRGITSYFWSYNGEQLVYLQDRDGDENMRLYAVHLDGTDVVALTPDDPGVDHSVRAQIVAGIPERPDELLIGLNKRSEAEHDLYLLDMRSGSIREIAQSNPQLLSWVVDNELTVRGQLLAQPDGGSSLLLSSGDSDELAEVYRWDQGDVLVSGPLSFGAGNDCLYMLDSRGRNSAALVLLDLGSRELSVVAEDPHYDVAGVEVHPTEHVVQAVAFQRERTDWQVVDPRVAADFQRLAEFREGDISIVDRTLADDRWLVSYLKDDGPVDYFAYDRATGALTFLFHHRPQLLGRPLVNMLPVSFAASDGLTIHGYLSLPKDFQAPGPLVLNVHGGPWSRDRWGLNSEAQWLANRGYACLQVNYRGSTGYGKDFINAADREWGGRMQADLSDAVAWAVHEGIADAGRVAIYGGSYGGYATLAGVAFTPELYCAGVSVVGPSSMETFLNSIPPYWESFRKQMDQRIGRVPRYEDGPLAGTPKAEADWTDDDRAEIEFLRSRSPLFHVEQVRVPMLIAQGANDPRVKRAESDQFVAAMQEKGLRVEYAVYDNEGHGFQRPENRIDFYRRAEKFLAEVLEGRYEE